MATPSLALLLALAACLSPSTPTPVRYFDPPLTIAAADQPASSATLRLVAVTGGRLVGEAMTWRLSELEVAFDDLHHWAEAPDALVERALRRALFATGAMQERVAGTVTDRHLEVEVAAFENLRAERRARVRLVLRCRGDDGSTRTGEVTGEADAQPGVEGYVRAMGAALSRAAERARDWLLAGR